MHPKALQLLHVLGEKAGLDRTLLHLLVRSCDWDDQTFDQALNLHPGLVNNRLLICTCCVKQPIDNDNYQQCVHEYKRRFRFL